MNATFKMGKVPAFFEGSQDLAEELGLVFDGKHRPTIHFKESGLTETCEVINVSRKIAKGDLVLPMIEFVQESG